MVAIDVSRIFSLDTEVEVEVLCQSAMFNSVFDTPLVESVAPDDLTEEVVVEPVDTPFGCEMADIDSASFRDAETFSAGRSSSSWHGLGCESLRAKDDERDRGREWSFRGLLAIF